MRIHNLYEDENGESHWRDIEVEWTEMTVGGPASSREHASGVIFRQMPITYDLDWHPAPRKQYVIHLDGDAESRPRSDRRPGGSGAFGHAGDPLAWPDAQSVRPAFAA